MSSDKTIKTIINGKTLPPKEQLSTPFLESVSIGDVFYRNGKRSRVQDKDWFLNPEGGVEAVGLKIEDESPST